MHTDYSQPINPIAHVQTDTGEARKAAALARHRRLRPQVIRDGQRALLLHLLAGNATATADDVHDAVTLPACVSPSCLGGVPGQLVAADLITHIGYRPARRPEARCRQTAAWTLADRDAAERWLAAHPPIPEPDA